MKAQKSLFNFAFDSAKNDHLTQTVLFSIFGIVFFGYYAVKTARMFIEDLASFPDGYTISCAVIFFLLLLGICLALHTLAKGLPIAMRSIKRKHLWYLYFWYSDEISKLFKVKLDLFDKINGLLKIRVDESQIAINIYMSDTWRKQDFHIQWLFQEEKFEELAMLKKADDIRTEFDKTNNFELLKNSSEAAKEELEKLQNSMDEIDKIILKLQEKESIIHGKLNLKN